jgi:hypothetical protein
VIAPKPAEVVFMSAQLVYHWRRGRIDIVSAGKSFHLPTLHTAASIGAWEKVQELRPGKVTLWDHCFERPHENVGGDRAIPEPVAAGRVTHRIGIETSDKLETYDYPGDYAQRFDGVNPGGSGRTPHQHPGAVIYVGGKRRGTYIHGWPPCNLKMCVVVTQQWDQLFEAIVAEKELSFAIEP